MNDSDKERRQTEVTKKPMSLNIPKYGKTKFHRLYRKENPEVPISLVKQRTRVLETKTVSIFHHKTKAIRKQSKICLLSLKHIKEANHIIMKGQTCLSISFKDSLARMINHRESIKKQFHFKFNWGQRMRNRLDIKRWTSDDYINKVLRKSKVIFVTNKSINKVKRHWKEGTNNPPVVFKRIKQLRAGIFYENEYEESLDIIKNGLTI